MRRRDFLLATASTFLMAACGSRSDDEPATGWRLPDEAEPHERTWMAFGASERVWGDLAPRVREDLVEIAAAIADFEPVAMLVRPAELELAERMLPSNVELFPCPLDDLWIRDTGPMFVVRDREIAGVDLNFNGWGGKQRHADDAEVARFVNQTLGISTRTTDLVMEGGSIEADGRGGALLNESSVLIDNRNPGWTKAEVNAELERLFGVTEPVWLPGVRGLDITDGHIDFYARYAEAGKVLVALDTDPDSPEYELTHDNLETLADLGFETLVLEHPHRIRPEYETDDFAAGYANVYVCNGAVIAPEFGDPERDEAAAEALAEGFPGREIVMLNVDGIAAGGGGIHCATMQQPQV